MFVSMRDPLPGEESTFRTAVQSRNKEAFARLFDLYPNVLWGKITDTLTQEDRVWMDEAILQERALANSSEDEYD